MHKQQTSKKLLFFRKDDYHLFQSKNQNYIKTAAKQTYQDHKRQMFRLRFAYQVNKRWWPMQEAGRTQDDHAHLEHWGANCKGSQNDFYYFRVEKNEKLKTKVLYKPNKNLKTTLNRFHKSEFIKKKIKNRYKFPRILLLIRLNQKMAKKN